jgi:hypothetical protein
VGDVIAEGSAAAGVPGPVEDDLADREPSDRIVQKLYSIGLGLHHLASTVGTETEAGQQLLYLTEELDTVVHEIREMVLDQVSDRPSPEPTGRGPDPLRTLDT